MTEHNDLIRDIVDDLRESAAQSYEELSQATIDVLNRAADALESRPSLTVQSEEALARGMCRVSHEDRSIEELVAPGRELWMRFLPESRALIESGVVQVVPSLVAERAWEGCPHGASVCAANDPGVECDCDE